MSSAGRFATWLSVLLLAAMLGGCAARSPRVALGPLTSGVDAFLTAHPLLPGEPLRGDEVGRTAGASYHLVQVRGNEKPHRHAAHDLAVVVLRGRGTLALGSARIALAAGDAALVPRGAVHWFANGGRCAAVALVIFTPALDAPDSVPADVDSPESGG